LVKEESEKLPYHVMAPPGEDVMLWEGVSPKLKEDA
jgi:hypothetical protein